MDLNQRFPSSQQKEELSTARPVSRSTGPHEEIRSDRSVHFHELFVQFVAKLVNHFHHFIELLDSQSDVRRLVRGLVSPMMMTIWKLAAKGKGEMSGSIH